MMKTKIIAVLFYAFILSGCQGFLEVSPESSRNVLDFYKTPGDFNTALSGAYNTLRSIYGMNMAYMAEVSTDNTTITTPRNAQVVYQYEFNDLDYTALNDIIFSEWGTHYIAIGRVNAVINRINGVDMAEVRKRQYLGEAQFLRGLLYFNLVRWFGRVPLVLEEVTDPDGANLLSRNDVESVYQQIISDLKAAEDNLPVVLPASDSGRATKGAAKTLLGKVYLTRKEYQLAADKLAEVMDKSVFPSYRLLPNYADVFSWQTPVNDEIIFNVQFQSGNTGQGSNYGRAMAPNGATATVLGPQGGIGAGISIPTADLIDMYEQNDSRKAFSIREFYIDANGNQINDPYSNKYIQFGALQGDSDVDFPVLRYSDVLLMFAEALNELNRTTEAIAYLNEVRIRAGLPEKSVMSQTDFRLVIEDERRAEFAFEFHRWFDLIRTDRYLTVMRSKGYNPKDHFVLYLIPQRELDINPNLGQNPDYN